MSRTPFIAGNWKMHKTIAEAEEFIQALLPKVSTADGVEIAICAPFLSLLALPDVDGALVGGASLDPESFAQIVEIARTEVATP